MRDPSPAGPPPAPPSRAQASGGATLGRRRVIQAGVGALLVIGGAVAVARTAGYVVPAGVRLTVLRPWQFVVVQHAARRIVAPDRPDAGIPSADDVDVAVFVDRWLEYLPATLRRDFGRLLALLEHLAPLAVGAVHRFTRLSPAAQDRVLGSLEAAPSDPLRAGFDCLRSLVFLGYYRDPRTWSAIGYDGPLVRRPEGGWR